MMEAEGEDWPDTDEERGPRMDFPPPVPCHDTSLLEAAMTASAGRGPRSCRFGCQGWFSDRALKHSKEP